MLLMSEYCQSMNNVVGDNHLLFEHRVSIMPIYFMVIFCLCHYTLKFQLFLLHKLILVKHYYFPAFPYVKLMSVSHI